MFFLLLSFAACAQQEMLKNGNFKRGLQDWKFSTREPFKDVTPKIKRVDGARHWCWRFPRERQATGSHCSSLSL